MLKIIGAGFGRTGTHSLGLALEMLGFGPCYNIKEASKNPEHTQTWTDALDGKPVDWGQLFTGYQSTVEWPAVTFLPELVGIFPQARVILTLRDPESWFESASATIFKGLELSTHNPNSAKRQIAALNQRLILEQTFAGRYWDKAFAMQIYQEHQEMVSSLVPPDRLLHFAIQDGWEPLCAFLDLPAPNHPFPKTNQRDAFLASAPDWAKRLMDKN